MDEQLLTAIFGLTCGIPLGYLARRAWVYQHGRRWIVAAVLILTLFLAAATYTGRLSWM